MNSQRARKRSLYLPLEVLTEMRAEAERLCRSLSWVAQRAWQLSRKELRARPAKVP